MRCPSCGAQYEEGTRSCTRDGARLQPMLPSMHDRPPLGARTRTADADFAPPAARVAEAQAEPPTPRVPLPGQLAGELLDGRYQVVRKVGEGGMSYVYLADDAEGGGRIAIKVLSPALGQDRTAMARLRREASFATKLEHPNVCHIVRLGETEDGLVYVVMPFVDGELLADRTHRMGHIPLDEAVTLAADIAAGLHVAHQLGIVHRDLKPENVMVREDEDRPRAVVMDFGLAKARLAGQELEQLTATGVILGTPEFMSPEQLRGRPLDARTDVYSLALVTYEMLTGRLPFDGFTPQELMIARLRGDPVPLRRRRPDLNLPAGVERVLQRALAREPEDRPASAPAFAEALANGSSDDGSLLGRLFSR